MLKALLVVAMGVVLLVPVVASAGDCPECQTSKDCGPDAFCVLHDAPVGCGDLLQLCCPGQACGVVDGAPSCVAEGTCCVVEDPSCVPPGGSSGSGSGSDSGSGSGSGGSTTDAGSTSSGGSSGATTPDTTGVSASGGTAEDSGESSDSATGGSASTAPTSGESSDEGDGCGCQSPGGTAPLLALLLPLALRRRRR